MNICKDCKHALPDRCVVFLFTKYKWIYARCAEAPDGRPPIDDLVAGHGDIRRYKFCSIEREFGKCGLSGKNFLPRTES